MTDLQTIVKMQMAEIDRLRAEVDRRGAEIDSLVGWIAGDQDALSALQAIYADPRTKLGDKIKASGLALPFERAKPASTSVVIDWAAYTRSIRLKQLEKDKARWAAEDAAKTIEHQPDPEPAA
jgi:hypothetical protein